MEVVSMAAEIYASAAGTIAQIWILSELFPRKQSVKKVYIVGWILLNFCIAHFVLLPNIWQSLLGMGVMLLMSCIMLEGRTEQKMLVIIACNVFMILVSMLRGRITFFLSGESINEISIQGSESLARVLGIVLTNTLYLVTAYILTRFFHDKIKLKKEEYIIYNNLLYYFPYSGFIINSYVTKCGLFAYMAENIFDFRHVDVYCQYYSFKNDISYKSAKSL